MLFRSRNYVAPQGLDIATCAINAHFIGICAHVVARLSSVDMAVSAASLANLVPLAPGNKLPRASAHVLRAIVRCRKLSPEMVEICAKIARDDEADYDTRLREVEIILNKAIPRGKDSPHTTLDVGAKCIRIEIVDPSTDDVITIEPGGATASPGEKGG